MTNEASAAQESAEKSAKAALDGGALPPPIPKCQSSAPPLPAIPFDFPARAYKAFCSAHAKHPKFANTLLPDYDHFSAERFLEMHREYIANSEKRKRLSACDLLACEQSEMEVEINHGNTDAAIEEAYHCVAVLMRIICVLEGSQSLDVPKRRKFRNKKFIPRP